MTLPPALHAAYQAIDPRIVGAPAVEAPGAQLRLLRWDGAGRPAPDLSRLSFLGADDVRDIVIDTLAKLPVPVAWTAIEAVLWFEVGACDRAWTCAAPAPRALPGDRGRIVLLSGRVPGLFMPGLICHELAHIWDSDMSEKEPDYTIAERDAMARLVAVMRELPPDLYAAERQKWIDGRVSRETRADKLAALWGMPHDDDGPNGWLREVIEYIFQGAEELAQRRAA